MPLEAPPAPGLLVSPRLPWHLHSSWHPHLPASQDPPQRTSYSLSSDIGSDVGGGQCPAQVTNRVRESRALSSKLVGGAASDHQTFTPVQVGQCRLVWCQEAPGHSRQGPRSWQACRAAPPSTTTQKVRADFSPSAAAHCQRKHRIPAFVWRELAHHLPTNEARLCKQRGRRQVVCLSGAAQEPVPQVSWVHFESRLH